ncbi:MAG TPA: T9SS type A sorting domain-containing protein [Bacteroidia bacterium]|nr:T9SS type A sorting domain-containing protein [Bacteroidia bacterium]
MKKILLLNFMFCILFSAFSQTTFQKTYGGGLSEAGNFIVQTADGGYAVCGLRQIPFSYADGYLLRLSAVGDTLWTNMSIGPTDVTAYAITQTADQGYVVAGFYDEQFVGGRDVYLEKRDSIGNLLWLYKYGGGMTDEGYAMQQTSDNGFIIAGMTRSFGSGNADMYIVKTDNSGNLLWTQVFGHSGNEYAYSIKETSDGGFIIAGKGSVGAGGTDMLLVKTNSTGNILWSKTFGTTANEDGYSVEQTNDSGFIIAGSNGVTSGYYNVLLIKTDTSGTLQWSKTYTNLLHNYGKSVRQTADGGYVIAGYTDNTGINSADAYLVKTDGSGNMLWSKTYGVATWTELAYCVQQTNDGGYILSGYTNTASNGHDVYIVKTDSQGNSGCNEAAGSTTVNTISLQVMPDTLSVSSGGAMDLDNPQISSEGTFATLCLITGNDETSRSENQISIYPIPSASEVTLNFRREASRDVLLRNMLGEILFAVTASAVQLKIDMRDFPKGIYFVSARDEKNNLVVRKIVKM